jgi:hypothetical protein
MKQRYKLSFGDFSFPNLESQLGEKAVKIEFLILRSLETLLTIFVYSNLIKKNNPFANIFRGTALF